MLFNASPGFQNAAVAAVEHNGPAILEAALSEANADDPATQKRQLSYARSVTALLTTVNTLRIGARHQVDEHHQLNCLFAVIKIANA